MMNWRAVAVGVTLLVAIGTAGVSNPVIGQLGAGLVGGFAAGYLAGGGPGHGAWHGLIAGAVAGVGIAVTVVFFGNLLGAVSGPLGTLVSSFGGTVVIAALALLFATDSAVAGAVGGWVKRRAA